MPCLQKQNSGIFTVSRNSDWLSDAKETSEQYILHSSIVVLLSDYDQILNNIIVQSLPIYIYVMCPWVTFTTNALSVYICIDYLVDGMQSRSIYAKSIHQSLDNNCIWHGVGMGVCVGRRWEGVVNCGVSRMEKVTEGCRTGGVLKKSIYVVVG